ncbi:hypothetical protein BV25DRAFT_1828407 [Artomyces pyxidatus]|uniref:Uncharacterized protein n=1 Tax=Artomyces pyxidatus TaxID=48021 RepID=A0ACB8SUV3_9AGAM|nr:hypothetical protein BV25DRAFT_1828407 [Artomyces pyxidatus]
MRVESIPVFPHTLTSIATVLSAPYARVAWVIPIRGSPPWHGATTSSITFESDVPPRPVDPDDPSDDILWTHASLKAFWAFLQNTATKHWLTLGSLSFSFHAARSFTPVPTDATPSVTPNRYLPPTPSLGSSLPVDQSLRSRLCDIDHIKVYCDANRAMLVRNVFDVWPFEGWQPEGTTDKIKVRVLRLARLALVDGRATGVLIS